MTSQQRRRGLLVSMENQSAGDVIRAKVAFVHIAADDAVPADANLWRDSAALAHYCDAVG